MFERLLTSFQNIFKIQELRTRVLFTLTMLAVYRVGAHIPTPGINGESLSKFLLEQGGALLDDGHQTQARKVVGCDLAEQR